MRTQLSPRQLENPHLREVDSILRACVHCGFCTATCPTYVVLGDEADSPRGRIYAIKSFVEQDRAPDAAEVGRLDRCLSCLSCVTTCPSGVDYLHLIDFARAEIETRHTRPWPDRLLRRLLVWTVPHPARLRLAMRMARWTRPLAGLLPTRLAALYRLATVPGRSRQSQGPDAEAESTATPIHAAAKRRVALLAGCAQQVIAPEINAAAHRFLQRTGCELESPAGVGCCGALAHHLGQTATSHAQARANIDAWWPLIESGRIDAIATTASGCGTTLKDYGAMLAQDSAYRDRAAVVSKLARDVCELFDTDTLVARRQDLPPLRVAYHSACSLQHGQKLHAVPPALLRAAGFEVASVADGHLCCGSAGVYNVLQPALADQLRERKLSTLRATGADCVATGNLGCMTQLADGLDVPIVHTVELLDWVTGGPRPAALDPERTGAKR